MIQRGGEVVLHMLPNVQQVTIRPIIERTVGCGSLVYTGEYDIYARLDTWGYGHKTVCHSSGEYARDDDGDGFCEVHVNTMEGFWSLLRSWLRPHRGISQEKLPLSASSSSSTTPADAEKPFSEPSSPPWSRDNPLSPQNPR
jgi:transposase-like protein